MIISASYRTDIPAFYGRWFRNRLHAGFCKVLNPYSRRVIVVPLGREAIDGYVFWTKNIGPFVGVLEKIQTMGVPFVVQYAINGYPRALEFRVTNANRSVRHVRWLREHFGPHVAVWRYDPVVFTSLTDIEFHRENFARLAAGLEGATNEVVVSFAQIYRKTEKNMNWAANRFGFDWVDPEDGVKADLAEGFRRIAAQHGMQVTMCSQRRFAVDGIGEASCISARRLSLVGGKPIRAEHRGNRPECECDVSRDIGAYDTCPHGCVYCYAVQHRERAAERFRNHNPDGEFLVEPERGILAQDQHDNQLRIIFD